MSAKATFNVDVLSRVTGDRGDMEMWAQEQSVGERERGENGGAVRETLRDPVAQNYISLFIALLANDSGSLLSSIKVLDLLVDLWPLAVDRVCSVASSMRPPLGVPQSTWGGLDKHFMAHGSPGWLRELNSGPLHQTHGAPDLALMQVFTPGLVPPQSAFSQQAPLVGPEPQINVEEMKDSRGLITGAQRILQIKEAKAPSRPRKAHCQLPCQPSQPPTRPLPPGPELHRLLLNIPCPESGSKAFIQGSPRLPLQPPGQGLFDLQEDAANQLCALKDGLTRELSSRKASGPERLPSGSRS
ncbi:unnamed protein product [Rangifer tarandus platyrhynchus]|uniref:Uncharacterized protein n=1 Tax=Rangifer tarandus platyrhynchus TaxID=3082113 RepID=A0ACB1MMN0_RANTA